MKINNKKGILFWITGLSGSGKTSLGKKIFVEINKKYGRTILLNGDDLRNIFQLKKYSFSDRYQVAMSYSNFCKKITDQKINLIFTTVSMFHNVRHYNNKNIKAQIVLDNGTWNFDAYMFLKENYYCRDFPGVNKANENTVTSLFFKKIKAKELIY